MGNRQTSAWSYQICHQIHPFVQIKEPLADALGAIPHAYPKKYIWASRVDGNQMPTRRYKFAIKIYTVVIHAPYRSQLPGMRFSSATTAKTLALLYCSASSALGATHSLGILDEWIPLDGIVRKAIVAPP